LDSKLKDLDLENVLTGEDLDLDLDSDSDYEDLTTTLLVDINGMRINFALKNFRKCQRFKSLSVHVSHTSNMAAPFYCSVQ